MIREDLLPNSEAADRWRQVKDILAQALERPPPDRPAFLHEACGGWTTLLHEVTDLLSQNTGGLDTCAVVVGEDLPLDHASGDSNVGRRVGAWLLGECLGRGGMGAVYLAHRMDGAFEQTAAVKLLRRGIDTDEVLARFHGERQILARLDHPGIARLLDGGATDDGLPFFVLERVDGHPVTDHVRGLPIGERLRLFLKICATVQYAHEHLVVHRDLKPGNILVTADGEPKLLDFGIAKLLTPEGEAIGQTLSGQGRLTPAYASPEQARGEPVTTASDVYALGALLYEMLVGRSPHLFGGPRPGWSEIARVIGEEPATRPSLAADDRAAARALRGDLDNILLKALEKEPARRYTTVNALADDVRRHLDGDPVRARPSTWRYRTGKFLARNRVLVAAGVLVFIALAAGGAGTLWQARRAERRFADVSALAHSFLFEFQDSIRDLPGSTPARKLLVTRALEYLGRLTPEAGSDPALRRELAAAYIQVGDVQDRPNFANLGDAVGAQTSYRQAVAIAEALPGDDVSAAVRADAWNQLGNFLSITIGKQDEGLRLMERAFALRKELFARNPSDPARRRALATSLLYIADAKTSGNASQWGSNEGIRAGVDLTLRAEPLLKGLHTQFPDDAAVTHLLAGIYYRLGLSDDRLFKEAHGERAQLASAVDHFRHCVSLLEENLARHPASGQARRDVADGLTMKAEAQTRLGDASGALADCQRGLELYRGIVAADPENVWARFDLGYGYYATAFPQRALGDLPGALASLDQGAALYEQIAAADPKSLAPIAILDRVLGLRMEICAQSGDREGGRQTAKRWLQCAERLAAAGSGDAAQREDLAHARAAVEGAGS